MSVATVAWEKTATTTTGRTTTARTTTGRTVLNRAARQQSVGLRFVGILVVLACALLAVLLILAAFHSRLAAGQYQLVELQAEIEAEREILIDLQVELKSSESPEKLEVLAEGALGLVAAGNPVNLVISPAHILSANTSVEKQNAGVGTDWLSLKELLGVSVRPSPQR